MKMKTPTIRAELIKKPPLAGGGVLKFFLFVEN
jgi:hypothetical protein